MYPIFLNLRRVRCLVVGGGLVAERKVDFLVREGGELAVIAATSTPRIESMGKDGTITLLEREYRRGDLEGFSLVFAATDNSRVNGEIYDEAGARGILVNRADDPVESNFHVPSSVRRGDLHIAVSTGGNSPRLARRLRHFFEDGFDSSMEDEVRELGTLRRSIIHETSGDEEGKRLILEERLDPRIEALIAKVKKKWSES